MHRFLKMFKRVHEKWSKRELYSGTYGESQSGTFRPKMFPGSIEKYPNYTTNKLIAFLWYKNAIHIWWNIEHIICNSTILLFHMHIISVIFTVQYFPIVELFRCLLLFYCTIFYCHLTVQNFSPSFYCTVFYSHLTEQ